MNRIMKGIRIFLLVAAIAVIIMPFMYIYNFIFIRQLVSLYFNDIEITFGLNPYLAKAFVILVTVVILYVLALTFSLSYAKRRTGRYLLIGLLVLYYLLLWWGSEPFWYTKDGKPLRCYVRTDKEILIRRLHVAGQPQLDRETGQQCIPITPAVKRNLEILKGILAKEGIRKIENPKQFFNAQTGQPVVWYVRKNDSFVFYNAPVFDPETGALAQPVTKDIIDDYKKRLAEIRLAEKKREEEEKKRREREKAKREEEKRKQEERKKDFLG